jgi:MarR family transcriptional regulator, organic hydroperoxide resistance regulator
MNTSAHEAAAGPNPARAAPEWSLGRLLSMAARLVEQDWNNWLASRGMTHAGLLALHVLETGPHTQRELAAASMVEEQTMSKVLDRLERAGHVTRQRDPADRRRLIVRSTTAGQQAYRAAIDADVANTIIADRLDEPQVFRGLLIQLVVNLLAARGEPAPDSLLAESASRDTHHRGQQRITRQD